MQHNVEKMTLSLLGTRNHLITHGFPAKEWCFFRGRKKKNLSSKHKRISKKGKPCKFLREIRTSKRMTVVKWPEREIYSMQILT